MHEREWPQPLALSAPIIERADLRIEAAQPAGATLISGDLDAAVASLVGSAPRIGLGDTIGERPFLLMIARDRGCLITTDPLEADAGWNPQGFAATPADDAWIFFTISGARADDVIAEGCAAATRSGSPSVATIFAGHAALLAWWQGGYFLGVEATDAEALARWFLAVAGVER